MNKLLPILALLCFGLTQEATINIYSDNVTVSSSDGCIVYGVQFDAYTTEDFEIDSNICHYNIFEEGEDYNRIRAICFHMDLSCITDLFSYSGELFQMTNLMVAGPNGQTIDVSVIYHQEDPLIGDVNSDNSVNVLDAIIIINNIISIDSYYDEIADINQDNFVDVLDLIQLINIIIDNYYQEGFMVLIDGMIDYDALISIGSTNEFGSFIFNQKKYFPTFYNTSTYVQTDEFGNQLGLFSVEDITTGFFNVTIKDESMNPILSIGDVEILDKVNLINISMDGSYEIVYEDGDFSIDFLIQDEFGVGLENISIFLQYQCNPDGVFADFGFCNQSVFSNRPTASFMFELPSTSLVQITYEYLDGTIIEQTEQTLLSGIHNFMFSAPSDISGGFQIYKYSISIDGTVCSDEGFSNCNLGYSYPNPFN